MNLALALFRSFAADALVEREGPERAMQLIQEALAGGSENVWEAKDMVV